MESMVERQRVVEGSVTGCCVTGRRGFISRAMRAQVSPAAACFQVAKGAVKAVPARPESETCLSPESAE